MERAERKGYETAVINGPGGIAYYAPEERKGSRCIIDDETISNEIFRRISKYLPKKQILAPSTRIEKESVCPIVGVNERLRFLKYQTGDCFKPHLDGWFH